MTGDPVDEKSDSLRLNGLVPHLRCLAPVAAHRYEIREDGIAGLFRPSERQQLDLRWSEAWYEMDALPLAPKPTESEA